MQSPPSVIKTGKGSDARYDGLLFEIVSTLKSVLNFT